MTQPQAGSGSFTENAIRPDTLMEESDRIHARDLEKLLTRRTEFVEVSCPACENTRNAPLWVKEGYRYVRCLACDTAYLSPRPAPALLDEYYRTAENYRFWSEKVFPASEQARTESIAKPRFERVRALLAKFGGVNGKGTMMEIGAGHGTFCELAAKSNVFSRVVAVEPTPSNAATCRKRGLEVLESPIEQVAMEGRAADLIVSFEVIEHLFSPRAFLTACHQALRPNGLVMLSCPNLKGFEVAVLGTASRTVDPEHLNYFHPASIRTALEQTGFEVLEVQTPGKLDAEIVRKRVLAGHHDLSGDAFLTNLLLDDATWARSGGAFQAFLAENQLSSHMWAVARVLK